MAAVEGASSDEVALVLGIPIADPEVMKKTQIIMACVGITSFFLASDILKVIDDGGLKQNGPNGVPVKLRGWGVVLWVLDIAAAVSMAVCGYLGVKRSNRRLLAAFTGISAGSCALDAVEALARQAEAGLRYVPEVVLGCFIAMFFGIMAKTSLFLYRAAAHGSLSQSSGSGRGRQVAVGSYSLLGIPMMDMEVLRATQVVFTSVAIIVSILGIPIVLTSDVFFGSGVPVFWLFCLVFLLTLAGSGYYGVKKSSIRLLSCFRCMSCCMASTLAMLLLSTLALCRVSCLTGSLVLFGLMSVFLSGCLSAGVLREKASSGLVLTMRKQPEAGASTIGDVELELEEDEDEEEGHGPRALARPTETPSS